MWSPVVTVTVYLLDKLWQCELRCQLSFTLTSMFGTHAACWTALCFLFNGLKAANRRQACTPAEKPSVASLGKKVELACLYPLFDPNR